MPQVTVFDAKSYDREFLQKAAPEFSWQFHSFRLNSETALLAGKGAVICPFVNDRVDKECLEILARQETRLIALRCAGYNQVDLAEARRLGIRVIRVPAYSPHAVAEHAAALLLTLNRKIHRAYNRVREHNFSLEGLVGFDLFGRKMGIVGAGKIGRAAAGIFKGFGMEIVVYDPFPDPAWAKDLGVVYSSLDSLLTSADVISLHLPLTPETHHLFGVETFSKMKDHAVLINTSRGKLVDTRELIHALKRGKLSGVALDVYEEEEGLFFQDLSNQMLKDDHLSHLLTFPNVLVTAHQAFLTRDALTAIAHTTVENIHRFTTGGVFLPGTELT